MGCQASVEQASKQLAPEVDPFAEDIKSAPAEAPKFDTKSVEQPESGTAGRKMEDNEGDFFGPTSVVGKRVPLSRQGRLQSPQ